MNLINKLKLANWFEISEKDYMWYILQGYDIHVDTIDAIWYLNGKIHRTDGPAIEVADGTHEWWINGLRHRTGGPAVEGADGTRGWFINGKLHRTDGPAIEYSDGYSRKWYLNGEQMTESEFYKRITNENKRNTVD